MERTKLLADTVARPMICNRWALMNRQETGFASSAIEFNSLADIVARYDVYLGEHGSDRFGEFVRIHRGRFEWKTRLAARASEVSRAARRPGPIVTVDSSTAVVEGWLQWADPDGAHTPARAEAEGCLPYSEDDAWYAMGLILENA